MLLPGHTVRGFFWRNLQRKAVQLPYFKLRWQNEISFSRFHSFKTKILNRYVKSKRKKKKIAVLKLMLYHKTLKRWPVDTYTVICCQTKLDISLLSSCCIKALHISPWLTDLCTFCCWILSPTWMTQFLCLILLSKLFSSYMLDASVQWMNYFAISASH